MSNVVYRLKLTTRWGRSANVEDALKSRAAQVSKYCALIRPSNVRVANWKIKTNESYQFSTVPGGFAALRWFDGGSACFWTVFHVSHTWALARRLHQLEMRWLLLIERLSTVIPRWTHPVASAAGKWAISAPVGIWMGDHLGIRDAVGTTFSQLVRLFVVEWIHICLEIAHRMFITCRRVWKWAVIV